MTIRKLIAASALSAALLFPAYSAQAEEVRAGATVKDPEGGVVGTIVSVDGDNLVLRTDRHEVRLPVASFTAAEDAVLFGLTQAQLNAEVERLLAQAQQAIQVGAIVHDRDGAVIGPVTATDEETITVTLGEQPIRLPRASVAPGPNGLVTGATLAELRAQIAAATGG